MTKQPPRVVVTGLGVIAPNGQGLAEFEQGLRAGRSGIRYFEKLKELKFGCQVGGIPNVDPEDLKKAYLTEEAAISMRSTCNIYGAVAALDCWKDAGLKVDLEGKTDWDTGLIFGTGVGGADLLCSVVGPQIDQGRARRLGSTMVEQVMASSVSAKAGGLLGVGGHVMTNSSACTTGTEAMIEGYHHILAGRSKRMMVGGTESGNPYIWGCFDAMRVLAPQFNGTPEKASRPMSASAGGFIPGSGAGALMLESLESAQARGVRIYAEILGGTLNSGGQRGKGSMTAPNPEGVRRCIQQTLETAKIGAKDITLINGHLTGTFADPVEIGNWHHCLGVSPSEMPWIQSTKSMVGHALGAAGAIESVACILQLHHGFIHPSINCEDIHPEIAPFEASIPRKVVEQKVDVIAKASFGFGDVNGCLILRRWSG